MSLLKRIIALCAAALALPAHAGMYTDLWWNPQESGWGMNVVQQLETAFVTLFVYGADGKPAWYSASDARVIAYSADGLPVFTGTLYRTSGPWQGGSFDPSKVERVAVGTISLEALARDRMRVHYEADGATVTREVRRSTFALPLTAANFHASFSLRQAYPGGLPYGTLQFTGDVLVHADDGQAFLRVDDNLGRRCEYRGTHEQTGKLARMSGAFSCVAPTGPMQPSAGTFELTDFEVTDHGITGYLRTTAPDRLEYGRFAAARY